MGLDVPAGLQRRRGAEVDGRGVHMMHEVVTSCGCRQKLCSGYLPHQQLSAAAAAAARASTATAGLTRSILAGRERSQQPSPRWDMHSRQDRAGSWQCPIRP